MEMSMVELQKVVQTVLALAVRTTTESVALMVTAQLTFQMVQVVLARAMAEASFQMVKNRNAQVVTLEVKVL